MMILKLFDNRWKDHESLLKIAKIINHTINLLITDLRNDSGRQKELFIYIRLKNWN